MVETALKWDIDYLAKHMGNTSCTVRISKDHNFKYYDSTCVSASVKAKFTPPNKKTTMKLGEFAKKLKDLEENASSNRLVIE